MEVTLYHPDGRTSVARSESEVQRLISQGFSRSRVVRDVDDEGREIVRSFREGDESNPLVQVVGSSDAAQEQISNRRQEELIRADAGSIDEQLAAGASAFANTATLGLTGAVGLDSRQGLSEESTAILNEETAVAQGIGTAAAILNPVGLEMQAARWVGRATQGLGRLARVGAFTAEGAAGGAVNTLAEAGLAQDPDLIGERIVSDMGIGALAGLGFGTVAMGAGSALSRLRGQGGVLRRTASEVSSAADAPLSASAIAARRADGTLFPAAVTSDTPLGRLREAIATNTGDMTEEVTRAAMAWDNMPARALARTSEDIGSLARRSEDALTSMRRMESMPVSGMADDAVELASSAVRRTSEGIESLGPMNRARTAMARNITDAVERNLGAMADAAPGRRMQSLQAMAEDLDEVASAIPKGDELADMVGTIQNGIRETMSDTSIWGEAASEVGKRAGIADSVRQVNSRFEDALRSSGMEVPSGGLSSLLGSPTQMEKLVRSSASQGRPEALLGLAEWVADQQRLARDFPSLGISVQDLARLDEEVGQIIYNGAAKARENSVFQRQSQNAVLGRTAAAGVAQGGLLAGVALGGSFGAAVASVGTAAGSFLRNPVGIARTINRVKVVLRGQSQRLGRSLDAVSTAMQSSTRSPFTAPVAPAGTLAAVFLGGSDDDKREVYSAMVDRIDFLATSPGEVARIAESESQFADTVHPGLPMSMGMAMQRQVQALSAALPVTRRGRGNSPRLIAAPPAPSMTEVNEFLQVASVVEDPVFGIEMMKAGRLSQKASQALAQSFPKFHQEVTAKMLEDIAEIRLAGGSVNYQTALMASRFAGVPLDSTMEPQFNAAMSDQSAQSPEQEAAQFSRAVSTREPTMISNTMTTSDRIMQ